MKLLIRIVDKTLLNWTTYYRDFDTSWIIRAGLDRTDEQIIVSRHLDG